MPAGTFNTIIDQGADWYINFTYENPNGTPINLTSYTAALQVRTSPMAKTAVLTLTTANGGIVITPLQGLVACHATSAQTEVIPYGKYSYDLEITSPYNEVTRLIQGTIQLSPETTRV
jgi:hypothetical protein